MLDEKRRSLLKRQRQLLSHLVTGTPAPTGYDAKRLGLVGLGLKMKRQHEAIGCWHSLSQFAELFEEYAHTHLRPPGGLPRIDGYRFAQYLIHKGLGNAEVDWLVLHYTERNGRISPRTLWQKWLYSLKRTYLALGDPRSGPVLATTLAPVYAK